MYTLNHLVSTIARSRWAKTAATVFILALFVLAAGAPLATIGIGK